MLDGLEITVTQAPAASDLALLKEGLDQGHPTGLGSFAPAPLAVLLRDHDGRLRGGLEGWTLWGWLAIEKIWVEPGLRGRGCGRVLLARAEEEAKARGCRFARLDTFDFQAPAFYRRCGYRDWGELPDFPPSHRRTFLAKALVPERLAPAVTLDAASFQVVQVPVIETERLRLRPFRGEDFDAYVRINAHPEFARYLSGATDRAASWRQFALLIGHWQLRGFGSWATEEKASGRFIGRIGCHQPEGWPGCEIGWALDPAVWGRGLAGEGGRAALAFAHERLGKRGVISVIHPHNRASIRVAEKLGGQPDGEVQLGEVTCVLYRYPDPAP